MSGDVVSIESDKQAGEPLLQLVMRGGRRVGSQVSLLDCRARAARELSRLPQALRRLEPTTYPVAVAPALEHLAGEVDRRLARQEQERL